MSRFLVVVFLFVSLNVQAQMPAYFFRQNIPVQQNGNNLSLAWAGGLNCPQFSAIDLNLDGTNDLFVFDRVHNKISTFIAVLSNGQWRWQYAPEYAAAFPVIYYWALLVDYDNDGRNDLFCFTPGGTQVYRNISTPQTGVQWQLAAALLEYGNQSNINTLATDLSAFTDIDNDGDIDILMAESAQVRYFRNLSIENTGTPGLGLFVLESDKWGGIRECYCSNFVFGANSCRVGFPMQTTSQAQQMHGGAALLAIDLDGDLDKDLLWGDVACTTLAKLENKGTPAQALMDDFTTSFPPNTLAANFEIFPAAYFEDVNFDGKKDLLVAPNVFGQIGDSLIDYQQSAWLYTNSGSTANPNFTFDKKNFLQGEMIDRGQGASAAFADIDGDGDLDMLIGNYFAHTGQGTRATLALYTNTGSANAPSYLLSNSDFLGLSSQRFFNIRPQFADVNGDGKPDLVISSTAFGQPFTPLTGRVRYFLNSAPAGQPMVFGPMQTLDAAAAGQVDDMPAFADVDNDGVQDLLVGRGSGSLWYYRNTGSNAIPNYQLISNSFGQIVNDFYRTGLSLTIIDADNDGFPDLVTADDSGAVRIYSHYRAQTGAFLADSRFVYDINTSTRIRPNLGRQLAITAADLDSDGKPELVIGSKAGGLVMLSQTSGINALPQAVKTLEVQIFPNPAHQQVQINSSEVVNVQIFDSLGRSVLTVPGQSDKLTHTLNLSDLAAGLYMVKLETAQGRMQVKRLVIAR